MLAKEDNIPHRLWKLALIKEYILSKDGEIRSAYIQLPNKEIVSRAINLYKWLRMKLNPSLLNIYNLMLIQKMHVL